VTLYSLATDVLNALNIKDYYVDLTLENYKTRLPIESTTYGAALQLIANAGRCRITINNGGGIDIRTANNIDDVSSIITYADEISNTVSGKIYSVSIVAVINSLDSSDGELTAEEYDNFGSTNAGNFSTDYSLTAYQYDNQGKVYLGGFTFDGYEAGEDGFYTDGTSVKALCIKMNFSRKANWNGLKITFIGLPATDFEITWNTRDEKRHEYTKTITVTNNDDLEWLTAQEFSEVSQLIIKFTKGTPGSLLAIASISLKEALYYQLAKDDVYSPIAVKKDSRIKKLYLYETTYSYKDEKYEADSEKKQYKYTVDNDGSETVEWTNPILDDSSINDVAEWLMKHYKNNVSYDISWRGDPVAEAGDIFIFDNNGTNTYIKSETIELGFDGAWSGKITGWKMEG